MYMMLKPIIESQALNHVPDVSAQFLSAMSTLKNGSWYFVKGEGGISSLGRWQKEDYKFYSNKNAELPLVMVKEILPVDPTTFVSSRDFPLTPQSVKYPKIIIRVTEDEFVLMDSDLLVDNLSFGDFDYSFPQH